MTLTHALIIKKQWLDKIFDNGKEWELRGKNTKIRGVIGLIESGSGLVMGAAELTDSMIVNKAQLLKNQRKHKIPEDKLNKFLKRYKTHYAWVLKNAKRFKTPVKYKHPKGAVVWVKLRDEKLII